MKTTLRSKAAVAIFAGVLALFGGTAAHAQTAPAAAAKAATPVMGIIDTDLLLQESLAAKGVRLERDKYATTYQNQVKDLETKLRAEDQELNQQRGVLAPDVYQQRATAFQQKLADFQVQVKDKQERLEYSFQQSMQSVVQAMMTATSEISKERGINVVMARNALMIFDPSMDITKIVLDKLNQSLTNVAYQNPDTLQRTDMAAGVPGAAPAAPAAGAKPAAPAKK